MGTPEQQIAQCIAEYPDYQLVFREGSYRAPRIEDMGKVRPGDIYVKHDTKTILVYCYS